jgi:hypothetical protein
MLLLAEETRPWHFPSRGQDPRRPCFDRIGPAVTAVTLSRREAFDQSLGRTIGSHRLRRPHRIGGRRLARARLRGGAEANLRRQRKAGLGFGPVRQSSPFGGLARIVVRHARASFAVGFEGVDTGGDLTPSIRPCILAALVKKYRPLHCDGGCPRAMALNEVDGRARELGAIQ